jgi:hypothetical protein
MQEVELVGQSNLLQDNYIGFYKKRYGVAPIAMSFSDRSVLKDLVKEVGMTRSVELLEFYLESSGEQDWFVRKGHSLQIFKDSIHILNALLGPGRKKGASRKLMIKIWTSCKNNRCNERLWVEGEASDAEGLPYSQFCPKCS